MQRNVYFTNKFHDGTVTSADICNANWHYYRRQRYQISNEFELNLSRHISSQSSMLISRNRTLLSHPGIYIWTNTGFDHG